MEIEILEQEINLMHERVCYALGDPKRVLMLYLLHDKGRCVNEIAEDLNMPQPTVSRHLRVLRERGLVQTERQGPSIFYSLTDSRIIEAIDLMRGILSSQLQASAGLMQSFQKTDF
jgi:ArsR family transcriptional regulator